MYPVLICKATGMSKSIELVQQVHDFAFQKRKALLVRHLRQLVQVVATSLQHLSLIHL